MSNDVIEQVLFHLRTISVPFQAGHKRRLQLRGSDSEHYRQTIETLATELLGALRRGAIPFEPGAPPVSPVPTTGKRSSIQTSPYSATNGLVITTEPTQPVQEGRASTRPIITLKSTRSSFSGEMKARSRSKVVIYLENQKPSSRSMALSGPTNRVCPVRSEEQDSAREISAREPSPTPKPATAIKPKLPPHHYPARTPRTETRGDATPYVVKTDNPATPPTANSRSTAPPPPSIASEDNYGRIFFEDSEIVRRMAEPLRKLIKETGIKRYGVIRCFDILSEMFGYRDYGDLLHEHDSQPPSLPDSATSPTEHERRYWQYTAALVKNGLSTEQAAFVLENGVSGDWLHFAGGAPSGHDIGAAVVINFRHSNWANHIAKKLRNELRRRRVKCNLTISRNCVAMMFGYSDWNALLSACGTEPPSLPDDLVTPAEQSIRLKQYVTALTTKGLDRSTAVDVLRACRCAGWIAFWGRNKNDVPETHPDYLEGATL